MSNAAPNARQAGIMCQQPKFQAFCGAKDAIGAAEFVRIYCGVDSRSELDRNAGAAAKFHELRRSFAYGEVAA